MLKRFFDITLILLASLIFAPLAILVFILVKSTSSGDALYWSKRVGINNNLFNMPKFRSMKVDTPALATHLMNKQADAKQYLTSVGSFLRKTSLDEIPQLWSVLKGDMSVVGPRPALFNQDDLIALRTECGVHKMKPGITGWAQVNGRDEIPIPQKIALDKYYLEQHSILFDCYIVILTLIKVVKRNNVSH